MDYSNPINHIPSARWGSARLHLANSRWGVFSRAWSRVSCGALLTAPLVRVIVWVHKSPLKLFLSFIEIQILFNSSAYTWVNSSKYLAHHFSFTAIQGSLSQNSIYTHLAILLCQFESLRTSPRISFPNAKAFGSHSSKRSFLRKASVNALTCQFTFSI